MTIDLNATIPSELIAYAESRFACDEAMLWLREQPRTWKELIDYDPEWTGWAAVNVFAVRREYEWAERFCSASNDTNSWRWCAELAAERRDYEQAEKFCAASDNPVFWRDVCAEIRRERGD